jgi:hypothetical protein
MATQFYFTEITLTESFYECVTLELLLLLFICVLLAVL